MNVAQAQNFIQGKFYSSDEESEVRVKRKKRQRQMLSSPNKHLSNMSLITQTKVFGGRRIKEQIERGNNQVLSLGKRYMGKLGSMPQQSSMSLAVQSQRRVTLLSNLDKERCIQMDIQDHLFKNSRQRTITGEKEVVQFDFIRSKTFQEDVEYYNTFLERFVESKEKKARNPLEALKTDPL